MSAENISIHGKVWVYQSKPNKDLAIMTLAVCLVSLIVVAFLRPNIEAVLGTFFLVTLIALAVFLTHTRTTNVEIDLNKGEVRKTAQYFAFTLRKNYPLQEFDKVTLATKDEPIEDGYRIPRYSVMLSGKSRLLELFSTDTVAEGSAIQQELSAFISLSKTKL